MPKFLLCLLWPYIRAWVNFYVVYFVFGEEEEAERSKTSVIASFLLFLRRGKLRTRNCSNRSCFLVVQVSRRRLFEVRQFSDFFFIHFSSSRKKSFWAAKRCFKVGLTLDYETLSLFSEDGFQVSMYLPAKFDRTLSRELSSCMRFKIRNWYFSIIQQRKTLRELQKNSIFLQNAWF